MYEQTEKHSCSPLPNESSKRQRANSEDSLPSLSQLGDTEFESMEDVSFMSSSPRTNVASNDLYTYARSLEDSDCIYCRWTGVNKSPDHSVDECTEQSAEFTNSRERMIRGKCLCGVEHSKDSCALTRMATMVASLATIVEELREDFSLCILDEWSDLNSYEDWCSKDSKWHTETVPNPLKVLDSARVLTEDEPKWRLRWLPEHDGFDCN
ncbi:hypothetical protein TWF173_002073 [Orbilia oligospora]|nr:hypothetical protein TWF173_002073 [Orbilia oligospora]